MFKYLKSEMEYYRYYMGGIILLPILFAVFAALNIHFFQNVYFLTKYFWSMVVGMGTYLFVFIIWTLRKREAREQIAVLIPIKRWQFSIERELFGIFPFVFSFIFIELLKFEIPEEQIVFIHRIQAQLGMLFIALVTVDLVLNFWNVLINLEYILRAVIASLVVILLIVLSSAVVYSISSDILKPFGFGGEEIYFLIWGLILAVIDVIVFVKRKLFLE